MIKTIEIIAVIALLIFSFFLGVKYSDSVKSRMSWLKTQDEQEVELPDLSNDTNEIGNTEIDMIDSNSALTKEDYDNSAPSQALPGDEAVNQGSIENQPALQPQDSMNQNNVEQPKQGLKQ